MLSLPTQRVSPFIWQDCVGVMVFYALGHLSIHIPWMIVQNKPSSLWYTLTPIVGTLFVIHLFFIYFALYAIQDPCGIQYLLFILLPITAPPTSTLHEIDLLSERPHPYPPNLRVLPLGGSFSTFGGYEAYPWGVLRAHYARVICVRARTCA